MQVLDFEHRAEQTEMAAAVVDSLQNGTHLLFEAGTGVGQSLAYLIPSLIHAVHQKRPCVVATNTINLQEQLLEKDIPAVRQVLNQMKDIKCLPILNVPFWWDGQTIFVPPVCIEP